MKIPITHSSRPRRSVGAALVTLAALGLAACSSDPEVTPSPTPEDAASDTAPTSDADPDESAATGQPGDVKDVTWIVGEPPASWVDLDVGQGEKQWQVREECLFTMNQPAGIDPDQIPVEQVLVDTETKIEQALGFDIDPGPATAVTFPVLSNDASVTSADVMTLDYTSAAGATGSIYAYREGEYALIIYTACSANVPFDEANEQDFMPFIDEQISINLEY